MQKYGTRSRTIKHDKFNHMNCKNSLLARIGPLRHPDIYQSHRPPATISNHSRSLSKARQHHIKEKHTAMGGYQRRRQGIYNGLRRPLRAEARKTPRVKQDGSRELITAIEAVTDDGYVFLSFLIERGKGTVLGGTNMFTPRIMKPVFVYDPYSKRRCSGTRLLILDGHGSHITFQFINHCKSDIVIYCLPAHSSTSFSHSMLVFLTLQHHHAKAASIIFYFPSNEEFQDELNQESDEELLQPYPYKAN